jgi:hypothetical protein
MKTFLLLGNSIKMEVRIVTNIVFSARKSFVNRLIYALVVGMQLILTFLFLISLNFGFRIL